MKKINIFKKYSLLLVLIIALICPTISGCFLSSLFSSLKLETPEITLHSSSKCISWQSISNAISYSVFCNDEKVNSVTQDKTLDSYVYDFSRDIGNTGDYNFYIIALANPSINDDSEKSNVVTYTCTEIASPPASMFNTTIEVSKTKGNSLTPVINGTTLTFIPFTDSEWVVDGYELYLYSNSTGLKVYPITLNDPTSEAGYNVQLLSNTYNLKDEIYAIRLGVVDGDNHIICSDIKYFNPDNYAPYTNDIYIFDGYINDCYIESIEELRNLVYYNFIYKISAQNIKLSPAVVQLVASYSSSNGGTDMSSRLQGAVADCFSYFFETRDEYALTISTLNSASHQYCIKVAYNDSDLLNSSGKAEPDIGLVPPAYAYKDIEWDTFYETCGYTMRKDDIKYQTDDYEFVSDKYYLYNSVSTSEQLYWAVENRITPICEQNSSAERIYNKAKTVLNSIISDEMSDYEKSLSIFDWICDNTSYDYYSLINGCYDDAPGTITPAYYLEGVFDTGYAVCDGFSKAYSLLCNMEGIECIRIVGYAGSGNVGGHAWNKVKLDINELDKLGAEYYLVDITWTELKGSSNYEKGLTTGEEASSHEFFLVSDNYVKKTHFPYAKRDKFSYYQSTSDFNYYSSVKYSFNGLEYGLASSTPNNEFDTEINSDEELENAFYYMLVNNRQSMEFLFDYEYVLEVYNNGSYKDWYTAIVEKMRDKKFVEQYFFLSTNATLNKETGLVMVVENNLLIDAKNEVGHLVQYFSHYKIYGEYELYITSEMLETASGGDDLMKAISLFSTALSTSNIQIDFDLKQTVDDSGNDKQAYFVINITPKV